MIGVIENGIRPWFTWFHLGGWVGHLGHQGRPDQPIELLQQLHVQAPFLDETFGVDDEEISPMGVEKETGN